MLSVDSDFRKRSIDAGKNLWRACAMRENVTRSSLSGVVERGGLATLRKLGFRSDKRLPKYYLNGSDAYRLKLWLKP